MSPSSEPRQCVLVLPTYNEIENIDRFVRAVRTSTPQIHVLIVDDNSPDGTGDAADNLARELGNMHVIHRTNERGLGSAYLTGFRHVLSRQFDHVITMDADFSHDPAIIPTFLELLNSGCDVVIGSRYCPGGSIINWPWYRTALSKWGNLYTRALLRVPLPTAPRAIGVTRRRLLTKSKLKMCPAKDMCFFQRLSRAPKTSNCILLRRPFVLPIANSEHQRCPQKSHLNQCC